MFPQEPPPTAIDDAITTSFISSAVFTIATIAPTLSMDLISPTQILADAVATVTGLPTAQSSSHDGPPSSSPANGECRLLGPFAIIVQASLGGLALTALVFKRWRERPQRPIKIWAFDVSKQVFGSVLVHIANLLMSMLSSGQFSIKLDPSSIQTRMEDVHGNYQPNPCSFYLLNLAIDTTIGIPILILILRVLTVLFTMTPVGNPPESIQSGNYGTPPRTFWWFKQSLIYFMGLMGMKACVLVIFLVLPWISRVGDWALSWTEGNEDLQVFFVMLFFPLIMNATQYYIIDSFIKKKTPQHEPIAHADPEAYDGADHDDSFVQPHSENGGEIHPGDEDEEPEEDEVEVKRKPTKKKGRLNKENTGKVGSGSSSEQGNLLHDETDSEDEAKPLDDSS